MKNAMLNVSLIAALALASATVGAPLKRAAVNRAYAPSADADTAARGTCAVLVRHAWTGEPLAGLPVIIERVSSTPSDQAPPLLWAYTGSNGIAEFKQLSPGVYRTFVMFNNITSDVARFEIRAGSHANVTLAFNPDID